MLADDAWPFARISGGGGAIEDHELAPELSGTEALFRQALAPHALQPATKAIADCYLIGFAEATDARLVTFDRGLAATAQFRQVLVVLLEPVSLNPPTAEVRDASAVL